MCVSCIHSILFAEITFSSDDDDDIPDLVTEYVHYPLSHINKWRNDIKRMDEEKSPQKISFSSS